MWQAHARPGTCRGRTVGSAPAPPSGSRSTILTNQRLELTFPLVLASCGITLILCLTAGARSRSWLWRVARWRTWEAIALLAAFVVLALDWTLVEQVSPGVQLHHVLTRGGIGFAAVVWLFLIVLGAVSARRRSKDAVGGQDDT
jgi:hypothetical protein